MLKTVNASFRTQNTTVTVVIPNSVETPTHSPDFFIHLEHHRIYMDLGRNNGSWNHSGFESKVE